MPAYNGRVAIVGVAESDYGRVPNMTEMQLHAQALQRVLEDSGLRKEDIDGVFCSSHTLGMPTVMLCEYLQIYPRYSDSTPSAAPPSRLIHSRSNLRGSLW
jgi:3-oxoacyl-[acyl-carrier-protein] synthase III